MSSFANAVLMGRLGRDPELKTVGNGTSLCTFSIAVNTGFGEREVTTGVLPEPKVITKHQRQQQCRNQYQLFLAIYRFN